MKIQGRCLPNHFGKVDPIHATMKQQACFMKFLISLAGTLNPPGRRFTSAPQEVYIRVAIEKPHPFGEKPTLVRNQVSICAAGARTSFDRKSAYVQQGRLHPCGRTSVYTLEEVRIHVEGYSHPCSRDITCMRQVARIVAAGLWHT